MSFTNINSTENENAPLLSPISSAAKMISLDSETKTRVADEVHTIFDVLHPEECKFLKEGYRDNGINSEMKVNNRELADAIWRRFNPNFKHKKMEDEYGEIWTACGISPKMTLCKFSRVKHYNINRSYYFAHDKASLASGIIYLNTVDSNSLLGNRTKFIRSNIEIVPTEGSVVYYQTIDNIEYYEDSSTHPHYSLKFDILYILPTSKGMNIRKKIFKFKKSFRLFSNSRLGKLKQNLRNAIWASEPYTRES